MTLSATLTELLASASRTWCDFRCAPLDERDPICTPKVLSVRSVGCSAQFKRAFGESPHAYLLTRRLERFAALLRSTDWQVADICFRVGLDSVGSFTTSFRRAYGKTPARYRAAFPPAAAYAMIPECVLRFYGRPQHRTFGEDAAGAA